MSVHFVCETLASTAWFKMSNSLCSYKTSEAVDHETIPKMKKLWVLPLCVVMAAIWHISHPRLLSKSITPHSVSSKSKHPPPPLGKCIWNENGFQALKLVVAHCRRASRWTRMSDWPVNSYWNIPTLTSASWRASTWTRRSNRSDDRGTSGTATDGRGRGTRLGRLFPR